MTTSAIRRVMTLLGCVSLASPAGASPLADPVERSLLERAGRDLSAARVGEWVTYRFDGGEGRVSYWRLAVVDQERDRFGRDACWFEIEVGAHPSLAAPLAQIRMLVARVTGLRRDGITRLLLAQGADPAAEVEDVDRVLATVAPRPLTPSAGVGAGGSVRTGAQGQVMTHAGTLPATPVEVLEGGAVLQRYWVSRSVPLLHLARLELLAIGHSAELWEYGFDAHSRMIPPDPKGSKIRLR